jgi:hypothetical protein
MVWRKATVISDEQMRQKIEDAANAKKLNDAVKHLEEVEDITKHNYKYRDSEGVGDTIAKVFGKFGITEETIAKTQGKTGCGCDKAREFLNTIFPYGKKEAPQSEAEETNEE